MIVVDIPRKDSDSKSFDFDKVNPALLNAVKGTLEEYPTVANDTEDRWFDRLFEKLYDCHIEYHKDDSSVAAKVIWEDDRDYTLFVLRWA